MFARKYFTANFFPANFFPGGPAGEAFVDEFDIAAFYESVFFPRPYSASTDAFYLYPPGGGATNPILAPPHGGGTASGWLAFFPPIPTSEFEVLRPPGASSASASSIPSPPTPTLQGATFLQLLPPTPNAGISPMAPPTLAPPTVAARVMSLEPPSAIVSGASVSPPAAPSGKAEEKTLSPPNPETATLTT